MNYPPDLYQLPALSIRQPWAWAIMHAGKDRENRPRKQTPGTGWHLLHVSAWTPPISPFTKGRCIYIAALTFIAARIEGGIGSDSFSATMSPRGSIAGRIYLNGWTDEDEGSLWFTGPHALRISKAESFTRPIPCKGALGFFKPKLPEGLLS